ncbi:hypothetical protein ASD72_06075 [Pseudoxanthomonas sp. Root630]|nr:hypothetical protein ASD72_06075 [Pseudoxanthomonas sp. Root630]
MIGRGVRALLMFMAVASLVACEARYRDVSHNRAHRARIGLDCELTTYTRAHGVTLPSSPHRQTDYVSIWNPGFTGPEMTFLRVLEPGTRMRVVAARACTNCLGRRIDYQVEISPTPVEFEGKPAYLQAEWLAPDQLRCSRPPPA